MQNSWHPAIINHTFVEKDPINIIPLWHFLFYEVLYHCSVK